MIIPESKKLNLGCGFRKLYDHWNVDVSSKCNPDQLLDLNQIPWPYDNDFFERITAMYVIEQIDSKNLENVLKEMYRISKDQAEWNIIFYFYRNDKFYHDMANVTPLNVNTFQLFDQKYNITSIEKNTGENVYGLINNIDIEITNVNYNLDSYWKQQVEDGWLGQKELDKKLYSLFNICESISIFLRIHKPGRHENLIQKNV